MKKELLEFLLEQRESLKTEKIFMYLRLNANGMLFVGFEYKIICTSYWEKTPYELSTKKCFVKVNFDDLAEDKHEKFMKSYEKCLKEIRDEQARRKGYVMEMKVKIDELLGGTNL